MEITINITGSPSEIAELMWNQGQRQPVVETQVEQIETEVKAPVEAVESKPVVSSMEKALNPKTATSPEAARHVRNLILAQLAKMPPSTSAALAKAMDLNPALTRAAIKSFGQRKFIIAQRNDANETIYSVSAAGQRYLSDDKPMMPPIQPPVVEPQAQPKRQEGLRHRSAILAFLMENPNKTSVEIRQVIDAPMNVMSSTLTKMKAAGELKTHGAGGNKDPFRFYVGEKSKSETHPS